MVPIPRHPLSTLSPPHPLDSSHPLSPFLSTPSPVQTPNTITQPNPIVTPSQLRAHGASFPPRRSHPHPSVTHALTRTPTACFDRGEGEARCQEMTRDAVHTGTDL
uniref:Uncharacterized protein n=1 Tax=Kalanchoe fedtschenkoi TaxID=63787 RepID=A0A7N0TNK4_KALFE